MCAAVTSDAVLEIADAFLPVDCCDPVASMLVTAVARICLKIIVSMADCALNVVASFKLEGFRVIEAYRFPFVLIVTLAALTSDFLMQTVARFPMTSSALLFDRWFKQAVRKADFSAIDLHSFMINMTCAAVPLDQSVMKWR
jgi:hypothetical protein